jgi:ABC-type enterobactin transport system permease subunit
MSALRSRLGLSLLGLAGACALLAACGLALGSLTLGPAQVLDALLGEGPRGTQLVVLQWRLPRVTAALVFGAALGVSGAIFQSLLRNPLGSPDILGFNTGAYSGTLIVLVLFDGGALNSTAAAMAGGLASALLVYGLAWRNGVSTLRLILIGIGLRALLVALNSWLIINASLEAAHSAGLWNAGSLNGISWSKSLPALLLAALALAVSLLLSRRMRLLEMGDDIAQACRSNARASGCCCWAWP